MKYYFLCFNKDYSNKIDGNLRMQFKRIFNLKELERQFKNAFNFLIMLSICLFFAKKRCLSLFILVSKWINRKIIMKHRYLKNNLNIKDITDADYV